MKTSLRYILILLGIVLILVGVFLPYLAKLPFGKLPGDIVIDKPNVKVYIPITSMLLLSIILSLILYLISIFKR